MSKDIVLKTGEFSKRSVSRADSSLSNVSKTMETIRTELYGTYYSCDGTQKRVFSANTIETVSNGCKTAHSAWLRLENISKYLDDGPERLLAVDRNTRSKYTNAWDRLVGGVSGGFIAITGGISTLWNNLFGKNKNKTGSTVVLNPYGYLADRFDWSRTTATHEEIDSIISAAVSSGGHANNEEAILNKLEQFYKEKTDPYCLYREAADIANNAVPVGEVQKGRLCTYASTATLLRRKQALTGKTPSFTRDQVYAANGRMAYSFKYTDEDGEVFSTQYESSGTVRRNMSRMGVDSITEYLAELLKQNPAGVVVFSRHPGDTHAILITDYVIDEETGRIQLFADDPVNNKDNKWTPGRVPIEETWFYSANPNFLEEFSYIWY